MFNSDIQADFVDAINSGKKFLITCHRFPDTDAVGSCLALAHYLDSIGKKALVWISKEQLRDFDFLPKQSFLVPDFPADYFFDTCIVCDCSNLERVHQFKRVKEAHHPHTLINIDHHPDNSDFGEINLTMTISSVGELLFHLFQNLNWEITPKIATCLYAAISFDTGRFAHSNVTSQTLLSASRLVEKGANAYALSQAMDENKEAVDFELIKLAIDNLVTKAEYSYAYTVIPKGAPKGSIKVIDFIRQLKGIDCFIVFQELRNKMVKVNLRSKKLINVSKLAQRFDGGGHERAAGILFNTDLEDCQKELFEAIETL